ncbi:hypothetical protein, partial [Actinomyces howellii]|uniref:hypothetical protein n=1 Tax=Actinomyces howellii TaxID=52771 RepID=UPI001F21E0A5
MTTETFFMGYHLVWVVCCVVLPRAYRVVVGCVPAWGGLVVDRIVDARVLRGLLFGVLFVLA